MSAPVVAIDGQLCAPAAATVSVFDRGFLYGDGIFTILRGHRGRALELEGHLAQLVADAGLLGLALPGQSLAAIEASVHQVLEALDLARARVRIVISRGSGPLSARFAELPPRVVVIGEEAAAPRTELRAVVVEEPRLLASPTWAPKSLSYQPSLLARERAASLGADEALRLFADDTVGEGAASNLFAVYDGALVTPPPLGIRPGVTRRRVLELCAALNLAAVERPIPRAELAGADELFSTSSIAGVVPIVTLDGIARAAGPVTARLGARYEEFLEEQLEELRRI
jgi:branched-chain amino acid aminotransferase